MTSVASRPCLAPALLSSVHTSSAMATTAADPPAPAGTAAPLRRATYVTVDKLVRSQYDEIDWKQVDDRVPAKGTS